MLRALLAFAVAASVLLPFSADASIVPFKLVAEPGSCQAPYYEVGWVGVDGARWRICQRH